MSTTTYPTGMRQDLMAYLRYIVRKDPREQAFEESTTLSMMEKRSVTLNGNYVEVPVAHVGTAKGGPYTDNTPLSTEDVEAGKVATYELAAYAEPARMSHIAELKTQGSGKLFDAWAFRVSQAKKRLRKKIATDLFASSQVTNGITGLPLIAPSTTTSGTYGNLNRATYSWWRPYNSDTIDWSSAGETEMDQLETGLSVDGGPGADWYVTSATVFNYMKVNARSTVNFEPTYKGRYADQLYDAGIQAISYCGKPVVWDAYLGTTGSLYAVKNDALYLGIYEDFDVVGPFPLEGSGVQGKVVYVRWAGQTICEEQRKCGSLTTISS